MVLKTKAINNPFSVPSYLFISQVHHDAFLARQQLLLSALFEKWDNECSGFLDMAEVDAVLSHFKEGMEQEALEKGEGNALHYLR